MTISILPPPPLNARLVFMQSKTWLSDLIQFDEKGAVSHVAAMMDDGLFMTANIGEGVRRKRQEDELLGVDMAIMVDIPMPWEQYQKWRDYLYARNAAPFDIAGLAGIATRFDLHTQGALFCASLQVGALRHCSYFERPLAQKYHMISPVVLLLMLQALPISTGVIIHTPETEAA